MFREKNGCLGQKLNIEEVNSGVCFKLHHLNIWERVGHGLTMKIIKVLPTFSNK